jgi:hypothetical protein
LLKEITILSIASDAAIFYSFPWLISAASWKAFFPGKIGDDAIEILM